MLDHMVSGQAGGLTVAEVLANQCCQAGSLLHKAAEMGQKDAVRALLLARAVHLGPSLSSVILSSASLLSTTAFTVPSTTTVYLCANSLPPGPFPLLLSSVGLVEYGFKGEPQPLLPLPVPCQDGS